MLRLRLASDSDNCLSDKEWRAYARNSIVFVFRTRGRVFALILIDGAI